MDAAVTQMICPEMLHSASSVRCSASDVLRWAGMHALSTRETDEMLFPLRRVHAESTLIHEGQPFETLYLVGAGSFKSVQSDVDGYEQVLGFLAGDFQPELFFNHRQNLSADLRRKGNGSLLDHIPDAHGHADDAQSP